MRMLKGTFEGESFEIVELEKGSDELKITCNHEISELTNRVYHPIDGHIRYITLSEGLVEAYLVLDHHKKETPVEVDIETVPEDLIQTYPEEDEEGNPIHY